MPSESVVLRLPSQWQPGRGYRWLELLNAKPRGDSGSPRVHMTADSALPGPGRTTIEHTLMMASARAALSSDPDGTLTTELGHAKTRREVIVSCCYWTAVPHFGPFGVCHWPRAPPRNRQSKAPAATALHGCSRVAMDIIPMRLQRSTVHPGPSRLQTCGSQCSCRRRRGQLHLVGRVRRMG